MESNRPTPLNRLVVVGGGAIGGSVGGLLIHAGHDVVIVTRGEHGRRIKQDGLTVRLPDQTYHVQPKVHSQVDHVDWREGDVAMVATKLQDAATVLDLLLTQVGKQLPIVCATNGIHAECWARERFDNVISMLVWMPATHLEPGQVLLHAAPCPGVLDCGPMEGSEAPEMAAAVGEQICAWLRDAKFDAVYRTDMMRWKYAKWITNLGSAAQAMVTGDWKKVATAARIEGEVVLDAGKIQRVTKEELLDRCQAVQSKPIDGQQREGGSTWQSFQTGRPMETPWIEGAMAELAVQVSVPAPVNKLLNELATEPKKIAAEEFWRLVAINGQES